MTTPAPPVPPAQPVAAWRRIITRHPLASFFVMACGLSWIGWLPYILSNHGLGLVPFGLSSPDMAQIVFMLPGAFMGPIFSAFFITRIAEGPAGVRRWSGRLLKWRVNWRWYVLSLLGVPALIVVCAIPFSGGNIQMPPLTVFAMYIPVLIMQFLTTGLAEEPGWRDFCLPRIQPYFGPLRGTIILGVVWGIWHLPMFITEWGGYPHGTWWDPVQFTLMCVIISVVMTWVFNRTGESLPIAILLHVSCNTMMSIVAYQMFPTLGTSHADSTRILLLGFGVVAVVLIVATKGKLGYNPTTATEPREPEAAAQSGQGPGTDVPV